MVERPQPLSRKLGFVEFFLAPVLHSGFLKKLEDEGVENLNLLAEVKSGNITDPETIAKIRQQSHDWQENVCNYWLNHEIPKKK